MKSWPVQDAKARFSEMLEICLRDGPQLVTKRGADAAVLVSLGEWQRMQAQRSTLKDLLLSDEGRGEIELPVRGQRKRRPPVRLG